MFNEPVGRGFSKETVGQGATVPSSATTNIWGGGDSLHITGTTTITSFGTAPYAGATKRIIFDGALTLTHGANLNLPGAANITTAAGDSCLVYADTTTQLDVFDYTRQSGATSGLTTIASGSISGASTAITNIPQTFSSLILEATGVSAGGTEAINVQVSTNNGGTYDTTAGNYLGYSINSTTTVSNPMASVWLITVTMSAGGAETIGATTTLTGYQNGPPTSITTRLVNSAGPVNYQASGHYLPTGGIDALRFLSGTFDAGTYVLYGVK